MAQVNLSDYRNIYLQTAKEYIDKMFVSLGQLSNDVSNKEALNNLHIASHSLRSQSQVMGFIDIANLSANIEKTSNNALQGNVTFDDKIILNSKNEVRKIDGILKQVQNDTGSGKII